MDPRTARRCILCSTLSTNAKLVALALLDHWSPTRPTVWPSLPRLAELASLHRTTTIRAIAELEFEGWIVATRHRGLATRYVFTDQSRRATQPVAESDQSPSATSSGALPVAESDQSRRATQPVAESDGGSRSPLPEVFHEVFQEADLSARAREADQQPQLEAPERPEEPPRPRSLAEALELPLAERASALERDPHMAQWLEPHRWPEVQAIAQAFAKAAKQPPRIAAYHRDAGVRALVACFAAGFSEPEVARAARDPWILERGLSALTAETVRRALAKATSRVASHAPAIALAEVPAAEKPTLAEVAQFTAQVLRGSHDPADRPEVPDRSEIRPGGTTAPPQLGELSKPPRKADAGGARRVPAASRGSAVRA